MARKADRDRIRLKVMGLIALMGLDDTEWDVDFGEEGIRIETIGGKTFNADRLPMKAFEDAVDLAISCFRFYHTRVNPDNMAVGLHMGVGKAPEFTDKKPGDPVVFELASDDKDYEVVDENKS